MALRSGALPSRAACRFGGDAVAAALAKRRSALQKDDGGLSFGHLDVRRIIGVGTFGRVKLVKDTKKDAVYALKCQAKTAIVDNQLQEHVRLGLRRALEQLDHTDEARAQVHPLDVLVGQ